MKLLKTILTVAFIAGSSAVAVAQGGGGGAGGGTGAGAGGGAGAAGGGACGDVNPSRPGRGADQNPTGPGADPRAGNVGSTNTGSTDPTTRLHHAVDVRDDVDDFGFLSTLLDLRTAGL